jgi:hypothetical protein
MRIKLNRIAPLLGAAAAAAAIATAPIAAASTASTVAAKPAQTQASPAQAQANPAQAQGSCDNLGANQTECQSPGNAQLNDSPPQVNYFPYSG